VENNIAMRTLFVLLVAASLFVSCDKSVEKKIIGTYTMQTAYRNGSDWTTFFNWGFPNWKMELKSDNTFKESYGSTVKTGSWNVTDKQTKLILNETGGLIRPYKILEYEKQSSLKLEETDADGNTNQYILVQ
jgi:hypothetical protein